MHLRKQMSVLDLRHKPEGDGTCTALTVGGACVFHSVSELLSLLIKSFRESHKPNL